MGNNTVHSDRLKRDFEYTVHHVALVRNAFGDSKDDTLMDEWRVEIGDKVGVDRQRFEYFTGLGHRILNRALSDAQDVQLCRKIINGVKLLDREAAIAIVKNNSRPVPPTLDSVLYCLVIDTKATSRTFAEWCNEMGYDEDSRRALATYESCQKNADKLRRCGIVDFDAARTAFQDF